MNIAQLNAEIDRLIDSGDERALEQFVTAHVSEFPEHVQKDILFAFYRDAIERMAADGQIAKIQSDSLAAMQKIDAYRTALKNL